MASPKQSIRELFDAGSDYPGPSENANSSHMVGWTTNLVDYFQSTGVLNPAQIFTNHYQVFEDEIGNFPEKDGVSLSFNLNGQIEAQVGVSFINVGLRHYWQQAQAAKGYTTTGIAPMDDYDPISGNPSSSYDPTGVNGTSFGVAPVYDGTGRYKSSFINMGNLRGLRYHTTFIGYWTSTTENDEYLRNTQPISVGDTA